MLQMSKDLQMYALYQGNYNVHIGSYSGPTRALAKIFIDNTRNIELILTLMCT